LKRGEHIEPPFLKGRQGGIVLSLKRCKDNQLRRSSKLSTSLKMAKKTDFKKLDEILNKHKGEQGALITILQEAQDAYGYLSEEVLEHISNHTGTRLSQVYGVATFYSQFRLRPCGKHILRVCHGTACYVNGSTKISDDISKELEIKMGETTKDRMFSLDAVSCLGACGLAPVMMINEKTYGRLDPESAVEIVKKTMRKTSEPEESE
jgi:NADH-quinone oxidoreductase E subunit